MSGLDEGRARRDAGTSLVLNAPAQDEWRELAYRWLFELPTGRLVTSTDLVEAVGMPPSPNAVGAIMRGAASQGALVPTDAYVSSTRPSCHAAIVRVWRAS